MARWLAWTLLLVVCHGAWSLMVSRCPEGWVHQSSTGQCFRIHSYGKTRKFSDARSYCQGHGGDLAIIEDVETKHWLSLAIAETGLIGEQSLMWVGAENLDGVWSWVENTKPIDTNVVAWEEEGSGDCAAFTSNSKLQKYDCDNLLHFVCHRPINVPPPCNYEMGWDQIHDKCYKKSLNSESWYDGRLQCRMEGGDLITITGDTDQQFATDVAIEYHDNIWIGLTEENHPGDWTWSDGSDSTYVNWDQDQPESMDGFGAAAVNHEEKNGKWVVERLTDEFHYLCQKEQGACVAGWEEFGNSCYYFNTEEDDQLVWEDAKQTCESVGAHLVVLDTIAEDEFFRAHMPETDQLWIGLYSKPGDDLYWVDDTLMSSKNFTFMTDENINDAVGSDVKKCTYFQLREEGSRVSLHSSWVPVDCNLKKHYVCEIPAGGNLTLIPPPKLKYCPEGWENKYDHCYLFGADELSWPKAQQKCKAEGGELASILTWGEQDYISNNQMGSGWIGLNDRAGEGNFEWSDGNRVVLTNWAPGEPNGNGGDENCVEMREDTGLWNDLPCHLARVYTCKRTASDHPIGPVEPTTTPWPGWTGCGWDWTENPVSGECYRIELQELSFEDARHYCGELSHYEGQSRPDLVSLTTAQEQTFVESMVKDQHLSQSTLYIGLKNSLDGHKWLDNTAVTFFNWNDGEPNGMYYGEECGEMYVDSGRWNDISCFDRRAFICEKKGTNYVGPVDPPEPEVHCPDGWNYWNNHCYYFGTEYKTWQESRDWCQANLGSDLTSILSEDENNYINGVLNARFQNGWIGLHDDNAGGNWHWMDGSNFGEYSNWLEGEPNNQDGNEHCGEIRSGDYYYVGQWNDMPCDIQNVFVCKTTVKTCPESWTYHEGKCYYASNFEATWSVARDKCKEFNTEADLVNLHSQEESDFFGDVLTHSSLGTWIGFKYNSEKGEWEWSDGQAHDYTNWNTGEPNNIDTEGCTEVIDAVGLDTHTKWNNMDCATSRAFGCEFFPTHSVGCEDGWLSFNNYCYYYSNLDGENQYMYYSFEESKTECQSRGAQLVSIHSQEENDFVYSLINPYDYSGVWIGLTDEGHASELTWVDNTDVTFSNYEQFYYNPIYSYPSCGMLDLLDYSGLGLWGISDCSAYNFYMCKKPQEPRPINPPTTGCKDCMDKSQKKAEHKKKTRKSRSVGRSIRSDPFHSRFGRPQWHSDKIDPVHVDKGRWQKRIEELLQKTTVPPVVKEVSGSHMLRPTSTVESFTLSSGRISPGEMDEESSGDAQGPTTLNPETTPVTTDPYVNLTSKAEPSAVTPATTPTTPPGASPNRTEVPSVNTTLIPKLSTCHPDDLAYKGSCYNFPRMEHSWEDAKGVCEESSGHLVVINDRFENAFLSSYLGELGERGWIGLSGTVGDDNSVTFEWVNGDPVDFTNWAEYEPAPTHGTCVAASGHLETPGLWEVRTCDAAFQYICEYDREGYVPPTAPTTIPPTVYCPDDWDRHEGKCYKVFTSPRTWGTAEGTCNSYGAFLTSIGSENEKIYLSNMQGLSSIDTKYSSVWVGLYGGSEEGYQWTDGSAVDFVDWEPGQPDSHHGRENCVSVDRDSFKMSDTVCDTFLPFICEATEGTMITTQAPPTQTPDVPCQDDPTWLLYDNYCYKFVSAADDEEQTWYESHKRCREDGGELASIHTYEENYWIESKIYTLSDGALWIGGRAMIDSGYEWMDGSVFEFINWAKGEPNNFMDQEDCIVMYTRASGYWNDQNCAHTEGRICKRPHQGTVPPAQTTAVPEGHCQEGWLHAGSKCFKFFTEKKTFTAARSACKALGAGVDMISLHSDSEQAYLTAALGQFEMNMWLGLINERGFHWVDQTAVTYTNWAKGEPNGQSNGDDCAEAYYYDGTWNDVSCSGTNAFVCMKKQDPSVGTHTPLPACAPPLTNYVNVSGVCYRTVSTPKTWQEAEDECVGEGTHLASVQQVSEGALLWSMALDMGFNDAWLGLNNLKDHAQFVWSDGWPTVYTDWARNEPNISLADHNCVRLGAIDGGLWFSEPCSQKRPFICKYLDGPVPTPDPPATGKCPDSRWQDYGGGYCYLIIEEAVPWDAANMKCVQEDSQMISIHSETEMNYITMATHSLKDPLWIGLVEKKEGFGWSDGSALDFLNWGNGEPNSGSEKCAEFYTGTGIWNDASCSNSRNFICKTLKTQVIEPTNPTVNPPLGSTWHPDNGKSGLSAGGIVGIVIAVLFVVAGVGFVGVQYMRKKPKPVSNSGAYSFDNALYSERYDGTSNVTVGGNSGTTIHLENSNFDAEA